jgi:hypothetical protein
MFHWHGALGGLAFEASLEKLCQRSLPALRSIFYKCFRCFHLFIHLGLDAAWHRTKSFFAPQLSAARDVPDYWIACPRSHRHRPGLKALHCTIFSSPLLCNFPLWNGTIDQSYNFGLPLKRKWCPPTWCVEPFISLSIHNKLLNYLSLIANFSSINLLSIFRYSSSSSNPVYARHVDSSSLGFSLHHIDNHI